MASRDLTSAFLERRSAALMRKRPGGGHSKTSSDRRGTNQPNDTRVFVVFFTVLKLFEKVSILLVSIPVKGGHDVVSTDPSCWNDPTLIVACLVISSSNHSFSFSLSLNLVGNITFRWWLQETDGRWFS